jgi:hypothetical protein
VNTFDSFIVTDLPLACAFFAAFDFIHNCLMVWVGVALVMNTRFPGFLGTFDAFSIRLSILLRLGSYSATVGDALLARLTRRRRGRDIGDALRLGMIPLRHFFVNLGHQFWGHGWLQRLTVTVETENVPSVVF